MAVVAMKPKPTLMTDHELARAMTLVSTPATVAARFSLILSLLAVVLSAVAIALAVRR